MSRGLTWLVSTACSLLLATSVASAQSRGDLMKDHRGGTLKLIAESSAGTIDPQITYETLNWQILFVTNDGLVAYKKVNGEASSEIVPDLAAEMPQVSDGGRTYVFKLREGLKFSDGSDLKASDVVATFERMFKVSGPTSATFYNVIVGGDACVQAPADCSLPEGVIADDAAGTVTFHLTRPDSEFLNKLAIPHASIVPQGTPVKDLGNTPAAATGPYMIESYVPDRGMKLVRNPHFKEYSVDAQPDGFADEIEIQFGLDPNASLTAVLNGDADWAFEAPPTERLSELGNNYADQVHIEPMLAYYFLPLNVNVAPFDNPKARQALAYAVDRAALVNLNGGPVLATPICQNLPAGVPGHVDYCPYTLNPGATWSAPDMDKARQLVEESGTKGARVTVVTDERPVMTAIATYVQSVLNDIGYEADLKVLSRNIYSTFTQNSNNNVQISTSRWFADFPAPSNFIQILFGCASFNPGSDTSINRSGFCDKAIDAKMDEAVKLQESDPAKADAVWAEADKMITDAAPAVALFQPKLINVTSKRFGNYQASSLFGMIMSQAWIQ